MIKKTKRGDVSLSYLVERKANKPWIIFLHGWGSNHTVWTPYINYFKKNHSILAPDIRGHGLSDSGPVTIQNWLDDVLHLMKKEKIKQAHIVAHSVTTPVAIELAKLKKAKTLILATVFTKRYAAMQPLLKFLLKILKALPIHRRTRLHSYWNDDGSFVGNTLPSELLSSNPKVLHDTCIKPMHYRFSWKDIKVRTLILQGTYDPLSWNQKLMNDTLHHDKISLRFVPSHHLITTRYPEKICSIMEVFL